MLNHILESISQVNVYFFWFIQASEFKTKKLRGEEQSDLFPSSVILNTKFM